MSEPAEALINPSPALDKKSNQFLKKETLKLVDLEKGLKFFRGRCVVYVANRLPIRQKAYELLYDLYSKAGIVQKNNCDLWLSIYDALPETTTFMAEEDQGCSGGALTVVFDSPIGLPADDLYKEEIDEIRTSGGQICEIVSLGIGKTVKNHLKVLASLFYCAFLHAWGRNNSRELIITVHSRHEKFYRRNIFFDKIGPERNYAKVNGAPTVLLKLSLRALSELRHTHRAFPFNMINCSDQQELELAKKIESMVQPMSDEEFYTFFLEKTDTWKNALQEQKDFIKRVYPAHETNHAEVSRALARGFSKKYRSADDTQKNTAGMIQR